MHAGTMEPGDDFVDAHRRHLKDAKLLYGGERWPNADHLYGLSAECGLKAVMRYLEQRHLERRLKRRLEIPVELPKKYRKHVCEIWPMFEDFAQEREGGRYLQLLPGGQPFADWSIGDRYAHRKHFDQGRVGPHRKAARRIRRMVRSMEQDGGYDRFLRFFR